MNAHNEQHDSASPVVKQNLTTQPAAAQEAVGWQFWHEMPGGGGEWRNGSPDHVVKNHRKNTEAAGIPTRDVYAAPVAAAPADLIERCREILAWQRTGVLPGNALREYANARWPDEHDPLQIAEKETAREAFRILARAAAASTSVALGIDLENFHRAVQRICIKFDGDSPYLSGISEVLDLIDSSPKGGSEARAQRVTWLEVRGLAAGIVKKLNAFAEAKPKDWCGALDDSLDFAYLIEREADKQAGDAEVQP